MLAGFENKGNHFALWVGMQNGEVTVENMFAFLQVMELPVGPSIPLVYLYPENPQRCAMLQVNIINE